ncbi:MAG: hypothetical protein HY717_09860 [Planctomycetes bacterium]|nr:hypothetical protein [Planctomycetota bacterium]
MQPLLKPLAFSILLASLASARLEAQLALVEVGGAFGPNNLATGPQAVPFAIDALADIGFDVHRIERLNDGIYGNTNSWIGNTGNPGFAGLSLGGSFTIASIAFGRDNGGEALEYTDRNQGRYVLQYTQAPSPGAATPNPDWVTIGEVFYDGLCPPSPWLRHRFNFSPVAATGIRLIVPGTGLGLGTAIDEIEIYEAAGEVLAENCVLPPLADLQLVEEGGEFAADNLAAGPGAAAFAPDSLAGFETIHNIPHLNDGIYGNSNSWIGQTGLFVGINFGGRFPIASIAFGRDNGGEAQVYTDRSGGRYILQFTTADNPDHLTPNASWTAIGQVVYGGGLCPEKPYLRHRFNFAPVEATGVRLTVPAAGLGDGTAIDELEVYGIPGEDRDPCPFFPDLELIEKGGSVNPPISPGDVSTLAEGNLARAADAVAFGTPPYPDPAHTIPHLNDGLYGNPNSWLGNEEGLSSRRVYAGIYFTGGAKTIEEIALGRDNLNQYADRAAGAHLIEYTQDEFDFTDDAQVAAATWQVLGRARAHLEEAPPNLRRRYRLPAPVSARAVRVVTALGNALDELELGKIVVNRGSAFPPLQLLQTGGPGATPAAPGDVPGAEAGNLARAADARAFGSPTADPHKIDALADGLYGDASGWLGEQPAGGLSLVYAGVFFQDRPRAVNRIALGRDNTGQASERAEGPYILQVTESLIDFTLPGLIETARWTAVGQAEGHLGAAGPGLRRLYRLDLVQARAVRIITRQGNALDEIELYLDTSELGEELKLVELSGSLEPAKDLAVRPEATAFAIDSLAGFDFHITAHLNDGLYGNTNSWIGESGNPGFAGINLRGLFTIRSIAFGRDNGGEAQEYTDRNQGLYILQVATVPDAGAATPASEWKSVGYANYAGAFPPDGLPWLRHRFNFNAVEATAVRILVPAVGLGEGTAIDELEVYEEAGEVVEPPPGLKTLALLEVGGPFSTPALPFDVPLFANGNLALAADAVAFGTPTLDLPQHSIPHLNDGFYGNDNSWLGAEAGPVSGKIYAGIYFTGGPRAVGEIALGRDNLGNLFDRAGGLHIVEYAAEEFDHASDQAVAAVNWKPLGAAKDHLSGNDFPNLRRRYGFNQVQARAIRVVTQLQNVFDEIELYAGKPDGNLFRRGDVESNGEINATDAILILLYAFLGGSPGTCLEALDADGDGNINQTDAIIDLYFAFLGGAPPAAPFPECGSVEVLKFSCESFPCP